MLAIPRWRRKRKRSTIGVSTINKRSPCFDRTATMWRTLCLLSLTLFTFDFLRASLAVRGEPIRKEGLLLITRQERSKTDQEETGARAKVKEERTNAREQEDEEISELVGKWRNNGEAVEPKWRDGDTVPLIPFPRFSGYSADKIDASEEEKDYVRRPVKNRPNNEQENSLRSRKNGPLLYDYEDYYDDGRNRRGYRERNMSRKTNSRPSTNQKKSVHLKQTNNRRNEQEQSVETVQNRETVSARYREIFQGRSNDYEQEFNDEEYLKPRPRKRKPPENYEFALVKNETLNEEGRKSKTTGGHLVQNAMELKSLLKMQQAEGLSLSEILQQRNFSLNDLLNGKADVIDALKMKDANESGDYGAEKATKIMSDPFAKPMIPIATPADKAQWPVYPVREPTKTINIQNDDKLIVSVVDSTNQPSLRKEHLHSSNRAETYATNLQDSTTRKSIATTSESSGKQVTTSMPLPLATNSMDLLQIAVKLQNSGETRTNAPDDDEIMEFSDFTDYKKGRNGVSPVWLMIKNEDTAESQGKNGYENKGSRSSVSGSESTLSIEKILSPTEPTSKLINNFTLESNRQFVKMDETVDYDASSEREYQNDAPPPIYHHLEHNTEINTFIHDEHETTTEIEFLSSTSETTRLLNDSEINENHAPITRQGLNGEEKKTYDHVVSELEPEARAEIFELFASGSAGKRLERLLKSRNMSLEELIALRQRGSSKVHLAEVSRIKVNKLTVGDQDRSNFKTAPTFVPSTTDQQLTTNRQQTYDQTIVNYLPTSLQNITNCTYSTPNAPMDIIHPIKSKTEEESFLNLQSTVGDHDSWLPNSYKDKEDIKEQQQQHRTAQIIDLLTTFASMPFVKDIQRDFVREYADKDEMKLPIENNDENIVFQNNHTVVQSGYVKEIIQEKSDSIGIRTNFETDEADTKQTINEKRKTLSNVKPSIIASGAILGLTIVVFLAIFIVCRIRQKQKYRYRNTFSRAVFQAPALTARKLSNSSSLSTVMVNVVATSTTKRPEKNQTDQQPEMMDSKSDIDNDSLDANDSWETIPDYMKQ